MVCEKCGVGYMIDDTFGQVEACRCWVCGNRIYSGYPKRSGSLICSRCGDARNGENDFGYCEACMRLYAGPVQRMRKGAVEKLSASDTASEFSNRRFVTGNRGTHISHSS